MSNIPSTTTPTFPNLAINNTLVVYGKSFNQELEAISLTALDLAVLKDVAITGKLEVDESAIFKEAVSFQSPVTFHAPIISHSINLELKSPFSGIANLKNQFNLVHITLNISSST